MCFHCFSADEFNSLQSMSVESIFYSFYGILVIPRELCCSTHKQGNENFENICIFIHILFLISVSNVLDHLTIEVAQYVTRNFKL